MPFRRLDLLIADDHKVMRTIVGEILLAAGCRQIRMVADGDQAFEEILKSPPHIAIVDVHMPSNGFDLLQKIRRAPVSQTAELPVIVMTGFGDQRSVLSLRDAGANEIVTKPLSARAILSRIAAVIDTPRPFVRSAKFMGPDRRRKASEDYLGPERRKANLGSDVYL